jgi:hypothetical protein
MTASMMYSPPIGVEMRPSETMSVVAQGSGVAHFRRDHNDRRQYHSDDAARSETEEVRRKWGRSNRHEFETAEFRRKRVVPDQSADDRDQMAADHLLRIALCTAIAHGEQICYGPKLGKRNGLAVAHAINPSTTK